MVRAVVMLTLVAVSLVTGPRPVQAGYDWCSVDPLVLFTRGGLVSGLLRSGSVDVQVLVPLSALPLEGTVELSVRMPSNVGGTEVLNTSLPVLFPLRTSFAPLKPATSGSRYEVDLAVLVPAGGQDFPVRLLVTNLSTGEISITEGLAGRHVRKTVTIVE